jgi:hypothetical protein
MNVTKHGNRLTCTETVEVEAKSDMQVHWSPPVHVVVRDVTTESSASPVHVRYVTVNHHRIVARWDRRDPMLSPGENLVVILENDGSETGRVVVTIEAEIIGR